MKDVFAEPWSIYTKGHFIEDKDAEVVIDGTTFSKDRKGDKRLAEVHPTILKRIVACVNFCEHMPTEILDQLASNRIGAATLVQWIKRNPTFTYDDYPTNTTETCIECDHVRQSDPALSHSEDCLLDKTLTILGDKP